MTLEQAIKLSNLFYALRNANKIISCGYEEDKGRFVALSRSTTAVGSIEDLEKRLFVKRPVPQEKAENYATLEETEEYLRLVTDSEEIALRYIDLFNNKHYTV